MSDQIEAARSEVLTGSGAFDGLQFHYTVSGMEADPELLRFIEGFIEPVE